MKELDNQQAHELRKQINEVLGCYKAVVTPLKNEGTKFPRPDLESTIECKIKIVDISYETQNCKVIDDSSCPMNFSTRKVTK